MRTLADLDVGKILALPQPDLEGSRPLEAALAGRRSCRRYSSDRPLTLEQRVSF